MCWGCSCVGCLEVWEGFRGMCTHACVCVCVTEGGQQAQANGVFEWCVQNHPFRDGPSDPNQAPRCTTGENEGPFHVSAFW